MKKLYLYIVLAASLAACSPSVPEGAERIAAAAEIYPDYDNVAIPQNIAPMNFIINTEGEDYVTRIRSRRSEGFVVAGRTVDMDIKDWRGVLDEAKGDSVIIDIFVKQGGGWKQYQPIKMAVCEDIDPYITYRLIEPSYVNFELMSINQRCLENFDEKEIYDNQPFATETKGQCINCHAAQDYNRTGRWQMHVRMENGGTLMADGGKLTRLNLKLPQTISAGVYPAWHPTLPLIVYSNNRTSQKFHFSDKNKIEVQDNASDLILYDIEANEVSIVSNDTTEWETFPAWSPDGKWLYYVSATIAPLTTAEIDALRISDYKGIKYNIYRRPFDAASKTFGKPDTLYLAAAFNASATLPRVSPDGRWLLFTRGEYGTFHIWHHDADLWLMDIAGHRGRALKEINSPDTESYHSWSSSGRWILFSSRRDDGSYTRLYIAHFDEDGICGKPFILPQRNPRQNIRLFKSYNVPEFLAKPITARRAEIVKTLANPVQDAQFSISPKN